MELRLVDLVKDFSGTKAVDTGSFSISDGKLTGLLGPSGCGKSTLLYLISGLLKPTSGRIFFGDRDVTELPPEKRGIGLVFQNYALYPHMTVAQNIAFPLVNRKENRELIQQKTQQMAKLVQVEELLSRKPGQLSGGQQQRVAIARALIKEPDILLLDEPLSNLDARLRLEMREEIRRIQLETGVTTIFVTHDQEEAMSITDEIVLMKKGIIQQQCAPIDMYLKDGRLILSESYALPIRTTASGTVLTGIRPEAWEPGPGIRVTIETLEQRGRDVLAGFTLTGAKGKALLSITDRVRTGDTVELSLKRKDLLYLFNEANETRIDAEVAYES